MLKMYHVLIIMLCPNIQDNYIFYIFITAILRSIEFNLKILKSLDDYINVQITLPKQS